ncbi:ganglioside GM2 activator-like [Amphibalanus amphitrite]|uniref:ganglioside GM2 activator-like n=1 Tax=Amphibalanus amphitrite TaxID=1232801 RepID=UPI001C91296B|nr:ganglioside GM2 activator-like [Amphibalanus amphitrite]
MRQLHSVGTIVLLLAVAGQGKQSSFKRTYPELPSPQDRRMNELPRTSLREKSTKRIEALPLLSVSSVKNCGTDHDPIQLNTLTLPGVIDLKASFNFSIDAELHLQLKAPLKVALKVQRYFLLWWVTVPCIEGVFGTCTFNDLCSLLPGQGNHTCPPVFTDHDLPCGCPAGPGDIKADDVPVNLGSVNIPEEVASGSYRLKTTITDGTTEELMGCFDIDLKLH